MSGASSPAWASPRAGPKSPAIPRRSFRAPAPSSRPRSATTPPRTSRTGGGTARPLHLVRPLRGAAREARRARPQARRLLPRARRRERPRRPRGSRTRRRRLLRQEHAADHAAARLVGRARHPRLGSGRSSRRRLSMPAAARAGSASTRARPERSTTRARSTRTAASRTGRSARAGSRALPGAARLAGLRLRHLPGACPWNRGIEKRNADQPLAAGAEPAVSLVEWLEADGDELVERYDRLYVPRNDPRWLRRNALIAAGNVGGQAERDAARTVCGRRGRHAARACRAGARPHRSPERRVKLIRILAFLRLALVPVALTKVLLDRDDFPNSRYELAAWLPRGSAGAHRPVVLLVLAYRWRRPPPVPRRR